MKVDDELDLHGYTGAAARAELDRRWASRRWHGMRRVRVIHGQGATLWQVVRDWCDDRAIQWAVEPHNPGVTILHPALRAAAAERAQHRPLARDPRLRSRQNRPPAPRPSPPPAADDTSLFEAEMERLAREERSRGRRGRR